MTNLLSTLVFTLATNVVEKPVDIVGPVPCPGATQGNVTLAIACWGKVGEDENRRERTTTITETITVTTQLGGSNIVTKSDRVVSNWTVYLRREVSEKWIEGSK